MGVRKRVCVNRVYLRVCAEFSHPSVRLPFPVYGTPVQARCRHTAPVCKSEHIHMSAFLFA